MHIYAKGDIIFCTTPEEGIPQTLSEMQIRYLGIKYIPEYFEEIQDTKKQTKEIEELENRSLSLNTNNASSFIASLQEKKANAINSITQYYDTMMEQISSMHGICDPIVRSFKEDDQQLLSTMSVQLEEDLEELDDDFLFFLKDKIDEALANEDDLDTYLIAYMGCIDIIEEQIISKKTKKNLESIMEVYVDLGAAKRYLNEGHFDDSVKEYISANKIMYKLDLQPKLKHSQIQELTSLANSNNDALDLIDHIDELIMNTRKKYNL